MSDLLASIVRTVTSKVVGGILGLALAVGVVVPEDLSANLTLVVGACITLLVQVAYFVGVRLLERKYPGWGRLLGSARQPVYGPSAGSGR